MNRKAARSRARKAKGSGSAPENGSSGRPGVGEILARASRKHEAGLLDEAEPLYRRVLEAAPAQPDALHLLGILLHQRGQREDAIKFLEKAVRAAAGEAAFLANLAEAYRANGRLEEAVSAFGKALDLSPDDADARFNLGCALTEMGDLVGAAENFRKAVMARPDEASYLIRLGETLLELGAWPEAERHFRAALALDPTHSGAMVGLAGALMMTGRSEEAETLYREAGAGAPLDAELHLRIGRALLEHGRPSLAGDTLKHAASLDPRSALTHVHHARALQEQGRFDEAIAGYEEALALNPEQAEAHYGLAGSRKFSGGDPEISRLESLLESGPPENAARAALGFSLAKMYDDAGHTEQAFERYAEANALMAAQNPFNGPAFVDAVSEVIETFSAGFFAARADFGVADERAIYILGMPRSGTSLVEQILASHADIFGGGERQEIRQLIAGLPLELESQAAFPGSVGSMDRAHSRRLGERLANLLQNLAPEAARVTDKMPNNFLRLAFIALIFPKARVIHCRRDALDTCLSCFFQFFDRGQEFTYDLADLGLYFRQYERLMRHWHEVLPLEMIDMSYERLVAHQEEESRRLIDFCGLDWDPNCLAYHRSARSVRSASVWQVRQPIYKSSVEKWRAYEKHLDPLKKALGIS